MNSDDKAVAAVQAGAPVRNREVGEQNSNFTMVYARYIDILSMDGIEGKSKPETMDFLIKYGWFL